MRDVMLGVKDLRWSRGHFSHFSPSYFLLCPHAGIDASGHPVGVVPACQSFVPLESLRGDIPKGVQAG